MKRYSFGWSALIAGLVSLLLSVLAIAAANEVFAFTASAGEETVVIEEDADVREVARTLKAHGLIRSGVLFRVYGAVRSWGSDYLAGEFTLDHAMSYDELRAALAPKKGVRRQIRVTIPEGKTTDEIIAQFVALGIGTPEGFADAIENGGNFGYDFLSELPQTEGRTHRLDGYLFPDTYFVYEDSSETEILQKLLDNFARKLDEPLRLAIAQSGRSIDETVRLASLVEWEAYRKADMPLIASVFVNRLTSADYPRLESDATVRYAKKLLGDESAPTAEDVKSLDSPYNTYRVRGLPPGAICSPGLDAIRAAIDPAQTDYYYFVSARDKTMIYSRTYAEHRRAVEENQS